MLNPWLLLGTIAFAISFGISLLMTRDVGGSLVAGATAVAIAWVTAAVVNGYHNRSVNSRVAKLKNQIRALQQQRADEYQAVVEMADEKERIALTLNSMQARLRQLPGFVVQSSTGQASTAQSSNMPGWDFLSPASNEPTIDITPHNFSTTPSANPHEAGLNQFLTEAAVTKQKITASLNNLQAELSQLNAQISEHRQLHDQLTQEIQMLMQQKQKMTLTAKTLRSEVDDLERCRGELDQYLAYVEAKKQELETGSNPLQKALKQLQDQVSALQEELRQLETQVTVRRSEKEKLDREMAGLKQQHDQRKRLQEDLHKLQSQVSDRKQQKEALEKQVVQLQAQKTSLRNQLASTETAQAGSSSSVRSAKPLETGSKSANSSRPAVSPQASQLSIATESTTSADTKSNNKFNSHNSHTFTKAEDFLNQPSPNSHEETSEQAAQELSELWTDFMVQLPEYEFQTLKAIAHESNPARIINKIAEDSLTTSEELINSINQRAQETIGERVIKPRSGVSAPAIVREHLRTIKKLIETYEYLTE